MVTITAHGLNDGFYKILSELENAPVTPSRDGVTKELTNVYAEFTTPTDRYMTLYERGNNIFQSVAETLWVLAGENKIDVLRPFLPKADQFSDNPNLPESIWRAAYGNRIRRHFVLDQLNGVLVTLKKSLYSRQAYIVIPDPNDDMLVNTKDHPCSQVINFLVRKNEFGYDALNATLHMRSNDCIWGLSSINYFEFTVIQEILADLLSVQVGRFNYEGVSTHIYERHFEKMNNILLNENNTVYMKMISGGTFPSYNDAITVESLTAMDAICQSFTSFIRLFLCSDNVSEETIEKLLIKDSLSFETNTLKYYRNFAASYLFLREAKNAKDLDLRSLYLSRAVLLLGSIPPEYFLHQTLESKIAELSKALALTEPPVNTKTD